MEGYANIKKGSETYMMLKYGPQPKGNHSYLVRDGKVTREAKWLLFACDLRISFLELCILSFVILHHMKREKRGMNTSLERKMLYHLFGGILSRQSIVDVLTKLRKRGFIKHSGKKSVDVDDKAAKLIKSNKAEIYEIREYIEKNLDVKLSSLSTVDPKLRKKFENATPLGSRPVKEFEGINHSKIVKNSKVYKMLKNGPLPKGDYSYLVKNGKITKEARWLMLASDLGLSFGGMCILSYLIYLHGKFIDTDMLHMGLHRPWIREAFTGHLRHQTVVRTMTQLKQLGFIDTARPGYHSVFFKKETLDRFMKLHKTEIFEIVEYVENDLGIGAY